MTSFSQILSFYKASLNSFSSQSFSFILLFLNFFSSIGSMFCSFSNYFSVILCPIFSSFDLISAMSFSSTYSLYSASRYLSLFWTLFSTYLILLYSKLIVYMNISWNSSKVDLKDRILNTLKQLIMTYRSPEWSDKLLRWANPWSNIPFKLFTGTSITIFPFTTNESARDYFKEVDINPYISRYPPIFFLILLISFGFIWHPR